MKKDLSVNVSADVSDSVNEAVQTGLLPVTKELGSMVGNVFALINNTILVPIRMYNMYAEEKIDRFREVLKNKTIAIPKEKLVEPSMNILGPTMEGLKYNLDEEHIKEMFLNILTSDMNKDKKSLVLPSFVEILKQLSNTDAKFLKTIKEFFDSFNCTNFAMLEIELEKDNGGYVLIDKYLVTCKENIIKTLKLDQVILDNLIRLGLIACVEDKWLVNEEIYDKGFECVKNDYADIPNNLGKVTFNNGLVKITDFGLKFLKVCI